MNLIEWVVVVYAGCVTVSYIIAALLLTSPRRAKARYLRSIGYTDDEAREKARWHYP